MTTLLSFPVEFQQGMKARGDILCDTGQECSGSVGRRCGKTIRFTCGLRSMRKRRKRSIAAALELQRLMHETGGARLLQSQDASSIFIDGKQSAKEHFGYTDGFGNPDFKGARTRTACPARAS